MLAPTPLLSHWETIVMEIVDKSSTCAEQTLERARRRRDRSRYRYENLVGGELGPPRVRGCGELVGHEGRGA